ncbi:hypothetical protein B566_EDAN013739 [Ephemera danica]|nr:hypothetical protein B566_EDAN013739 [Ephemera danica]
MTQGGTIKTLVDLLHIERSKTGHKTLHEEVADHVTSMLMAGIEEIAGARGDYYIRRKLENFDDKYLKRIFMNPDAENDLTRLFEKLTLTEHFAHLYGPVTLVEDSRALFGLGSQESLEGLSTDKMQQAGYLRISELFPGVELRRRGTLMPGSPTMSAQMPPPRRGRSLTEAEIQTGSNALTFRKAVRNTPYQRELREHLQRRLMTARRITHMAALASRHQSAQSALPSSPGGASTVDQSQDPEFFTHPRRQVHSELQGIFPEDLQGMEAIFNRTNRRLSLARQRSLSASERFGRSMSDDEQSSLVLHQLQPPSSGSAQAQLLDINEAEADELLLTPFAHPHVPSRRSEPEEDRTSNESEV